MAENRKHHYVPRFLLKRFSKDKNSIGLYNIKSRRKVPTSNLYNQCQQPYFYGKDTAFEKGLSDVEGEFATLLGKMDKAIVPPPLWGYSHDMLLWFVLSQYGRTKYAAEKLNETYDKMTKASFREFFKKKGIDIDQFFIGVEDSGKAAMRIIMRGYPILLDLEYKMLVNKTTEDFCLSDNPVVLYNQLLSWRKTVSNCGLASKGLQIFAPIDSKKTLMLYDEHVYRVGSNMKGAIEITNPRDIYQLNALQFISANSNIYFEDPNFNVEALQKKAEPFLRKEKAIVQVHKTIEPDGSEGMVISNSSEDICTNLQLSFVTLRGAAKNWRDGIRQLRKGPALVVRNKKLLDAHEKFDRAFKAGKYQGSEFKKFVLDQIKEREEGYAD